MFEMVEFSNFQNVSLVPFPWSATTAKFFGRATHTHHLLFFCKLTSVKPWSPPSTQTGYVKGISLMAWNSIYVLITTKCLSSSEASLLNSRREYAAVYLTSPHGYLTDHFKFSVSKTEHLISSPSKPSLATAFTISADDSLKIPIKSKVLETSWTPFFLSLTTFSQTGNLILRKYLESNLSTSTAFTLIWTILISHLGYSHSLLLGLPESTPAPEVCSLYCSQSGPFLKRGFRGLLCSKSCSASLFLSE